MKINLAKSAGFCFGVKRAIDIALKTATQNNQVYMLGDIVHNEDVAEQIKKAGVIKLKKLLPGKNRTLIIPAHGISLSILNKAREMGYKIIDATCPMVKEIHKIVRDMEEKCCTIIVIGDKDHDEVRGIVGHLKKNAIVIDHPKNIPIKTIAHIKKACVVAQSTQNTQNVLMILKILKKYTKDLKFFNTICRPTRMKQKEIRDLPHKNDVIIVIGSKTSANTKRLYEISKSLNKRSYWINSADEIRRDWLKRAKSVGITAGASTPESTTEKIIKYIEQLNQATT